jgi:hypothetical protein
MDWKINPNAVNQFSKGTEFYTEGDPVFSIAMVIKGRVSIHNSGSKVIVGSGAFLGINDLYTGRFQSTYTAYDELLIYVFPIQRIEELDFVLSINKDYHGFMVATFYKLIYELDQIYQNMLKNGTEIYQFLNMTYKKYLDLTARSGADIKRQDRFDSLEVFESEIELIRDKINYYAECRNLPIDAVKLFYSYGNSITLYQVEEQANVVNQQTEVLKEMAEKFISIAECLVDDTDDSLFNLIAGISTESEKVSSDDLMDIMDSIIEKINKAETFSERMLGRKLYVNRKRMEEVYHFLLTGDKGKNVSPKKYSGHSEEEIRQALAETEDSYTAILSYAGLEEGRAKEMMAVMDDFINLQDKASTEDKARALRRRLTDNHYELYKSVFLRAHKESKLPRIIELFLKYGYSDERLLTREQLIWMYFLDEEEPKQEYCRIHDIYSWLSLIYEGKREPSKNEFDLEYPEMISGLKKQGKLTEKEAHKWLTDPEKKVDYEIQNMFRYNNRTTSGQITSFVPVLHKEQWAYNVDRLQTTSSKVNDAIVELLRIDYSIFDRELLYVNKEKNIVKEYIIKKVYPDIILMPNIGSNGVMWQEIAGKRRDSAGRFLLPAFTDMNIVNLLTRVFGRFRWELCRTVEGAAWNDIKHKSLTSEYCDYIQFYRKNKELSEEKKEKVKHQIQKGRSSSREIFVIDYEQWINYEAFGAVKLNKPVREIMATYCPFSKEIREQLKLQPLFEEAMARYYREKQKKVREIEGRHRLLLKDQIEITKELEDTLNYYRDL